MEAIIASTATAAQLIGIQDAVGTLTKGMEADLVILKGNPLRRIDVLRDRDKIVGVMKAGKFVAGPLSN
jgi:imidazolonepropionase-like amidohydrolase